MTPKITREEPTFTSRSDELGTNYAVYVHSPAPGSGPGPWPAAILLDGDYSFDPAVAAYRALREAGAIGEILIAAVGYRRPFGDPGNRRGRDYTPTSASDEPGSGGADGFLAHLTGPLWRELSGRYPVERATTMLSGHSLSALLVLHAVFQEKPFFTRALAGAPSLWWDSHSFFGRLRRFRDRQSALPARLLLGIGAEDTPSMLEDLTRLEAQLAERPFTGLALESVKIAGRNHYNVLPDLFSAGLRTLFASGTGRESAS